MQNHPEKKTSAEILVYEVIEGYKEAMSLFLNPTEKGTPEKILVFIESIDDSTEDLRHYFSDQEASIHSPSHWIAILRFIRISISLTNEIRTHYDDFVSSYTKLSSISSPEENQEQLKNEIGNFLYKVDDLTGRQERLLNHLIEEIKNILMDTFGVWENPAEQFFRTEITLDAMVRIEEDLKELSQLCFELVLESRIMHGLKKLNQLIMD
ncbi:MAG: hypothetical protein OEZ34_04730 [Spirochaetia bacterium]|nr:hypothetical protein [Spirochaetia bacterium]